ncbi:hypothetical protein P280DRAFT_536362 [Massarina eburnea CBS 473.64]|uniref:Uncharacterized protein n=1 Tax=Massarina eburnea CBS 473.64 TaxID=1395130 RepID=A0A6A6RMS4_9PLEO|nr:hypothetical protein P280DRAFT_536362 [Massarina eburnea CBS 473.64]
MYRGGLGMYMVVGHDRSSMTCINDLRRVVSVRLHLARYPRSTDCSLKVAVDPFVRHDDGDSSVEGRECGDALEECVASEGLIDRDDIDEEVTESLILGRKYRAGKVAGGMVCLVCIPSLGKHSGCGRVGQRQLDDLDRKLSPFCVSARCYPF